MHLLLRIRRGGLHITLLLNTTRHDEQGPFTRFRRSELHLAILDVRVRDRQLRAMSGASAEISLSRIMVFLWPLRAVFVVHRQLSPTLIN